MLCTSGFVDDVLFFIQCTIWCIMCIYKRVKHMAETTALIPIKFWSVSQ